MSSLSLEGEIALVTGGRGGIGKAIALAFAEAGADIAVCDLVVDDGQLSTVADEIQGLGRRSVAIQADVSQKSEVDNLVKKVVDELGAVDILVNNAGTSGLDLTSASPEELWYRGIGANLTGCFLCYQAVIEEMVERKKGNIISIASVEGLKAGVTASFLSRLRTRAPQGSPTSLNPYSVSKAGIIMLTRVLGRQLASYGIRVNAIAPGATRTEMTRFLWDDPEILREVEASIPLGRFAEPSEMASVALFLASEASSYITGHTIVVDGGLLA